MSTSEAINEKHIADALLNIREAIECLQICISSSAIESAAASVASCVVSKRTGKECTATPNRP